MRRLCNFGSQTNQSLQGQLVSITLLTGRVAEFMMEGTGDLDAGMEGADSWIEVKICNPQEQFEA